MLVCHALASRAVITPIAVVCMMELMRLDHRLSGLDASPRDSEISGSNILLLLINLCLGPIPFRRRCLTNSSLPCDVRRTSLSLKVVLRIYRSGSSPSLSRPCKTRARTSSWVLPDPHLDGIERAASLKRYNLAGDAIA